MRMRWWSETGAPSRALLLLLLLLTLLEAQAFRLYSQRRVHLPALEMNCFEMPMKLTALTPAMMKSEAWRTQKKLKLSASSPAPPAPAAPPRTPPDPSLNTHEIQKRFDHLFAAGDDIVKEHAKLVQDINSLKQAVWVAPLQDDAAGWDESVYHEVIDPAPTTPRAPPPPPPPPPPSPTTGRPRGGIPVLLLGGASSRQSVKASPASLVGLMLPRPTISLVGASSSPLRHPYPFVSPSQKPYRVCMPTVAMPLYPAATTPRPSLWSRLLAFFPRLTG